MAINSENPIELFIFGAYYAYWSLNFGSKMKWKAIINATTEYNGINLYTFENEKYPN